MSNQFMAHAQERGYFFPSVFLTPKRETNVKQPNPAPFGDKGLDQVVKVLEYEIWGDLQLGNPQ